MNPFERADHCVDRHLMVQRAADEMDADDLREWHRNEHSAGAAVPADHHHAVDQL